MDISYLKILTTILLALVGWLIAHHFSNQRSIASKQRDIVTEHLINSYNILTNEISNRKPTPERYKSLEELISGIQLFGSEEQITLTKELASKIAEGNNFDLDPIINNLRNDLRGRLNLSTVMGNVLWLRNNE